MSFVVEALRSRLEEQPGPAFSSYGALVDIRPLQSRQRSYSKVHRLCLQFEKGELDVCVKVHRRRHGRFEPECVEWAREEFRLLEALASLSNGNGALSVVKPLVFLPQVPAVVLETHRGEILTSLMSRKRLLPWRGPGRERIEAVFFQIGASLRDLQRLFARSPRLQVLLREIEPLELGPEQVLQSADEGLSKALGLCGRRQGEVLAESYGGAREAFVRSIAGGKAPRTGVHGDFTPLNLFVDPTGVTLFDFVNFHRGHPFEDVGRFLAYTHFFGKDPIRYPRGRVRRLMERFMEGYGLTGWRRDGVLMFFFKKNLFRTLTGGLKYREGSRMRRWVYTQAMLRRFHRWVEQGAGWP